MVTNYPQMALTWRLRTNATTTQTHGDGVARVGLAASGCSAAYTARRAAAFEHDRMSLRCVSCGHETPGWELNEAPPTVTCAASAASCAARPQLVDRATRSRSRSRQFCMNRA